MEGIGMNTCNINMKHMQKHRNHGTHSCDGIASYICFLMALAPKKCTQSEC